MHDRFDCNLIEQNNTSESESASECERDRRGLRGQEKETSRPLSLCLSLIYGQRKEEEGEMCTIIIIIIIIII